MVRSNAKTFYTIDHLWQEKKKNQKSDKNSSRRGWCDVHANCDRNGNEDTPSPVSLPHQYVGAIP